MAHHDLKILPRYFELLLTDEKPFEVRVNDRNYQVGDTVLLREFGYDPLEMADHGYTGRAEKRAITYVFTGDDAIGLVLPDNLCVFGLSRPWRRGQEAQ